MTHSFRLIMNDIPRLVYYLMIGRWIDSLVTLFIKYIYMRIGRKKRRDVLLKEKTTLS